MDFYVHETETQDWILPCIPTVATIKTAASEKKELVLRYGDFYYSERLTAFFLLTIESSYDKFHYFSVIPLTKLLSSLDGNKRNNAELLQQEVNDFYYVGNFFMDGFDGIFNNIRDIMESPVNIQQNQSYFMTHWNNRNGDAEDRFMDYLSLEYDNIMNLPVFDSKEYREKRIGNIQKEHIFSKDRTFHVYMTSKISNRLYKRLEFKAFGFEDSIFYMNDKQKKISDICMFTFNEAGIPSIFSFSTDTFYCLPKDISEIVVEGKMVYPFSNGHISRHQPHVEKAEFPYLDDVNYLYYYDILKGRQHAQKKEEQVHESI